MMMSIQFHNQSCVHYVLIATLWFIVEDLFLGM